MDICGAYLDKRMAERGEGEGKGKKGGEVEKRPSGNMLYPNTTRLSVRYENGNL